MSRPRLNRRLVLETPTRAADGAGGFAVVWAPIGVIWAEVQARTGREAAGIAVPLSKVLYRITVRATPHGGPSRPRPDQRFREGERVFKILAVTEADAEARYLVCHAEEETAA